MAKKITYEEVLKNIEEKYGKEYTIVSEYKNAHTDLIVKHNKCGKEFETSYKRLVTDGQRCPNTKKDPGTI